MQSYPVQLLQQMLEAYSPSGSETEVAALLNDEMSSRGFRVHSDKVGNIIGKIGSEGPRILLCGHMDTVPGKLPVRIVGESLYGRGAVDAKSALAAMIAGTLASKEKSELPFRVTIAAVVEEETSSKGVKSIMDRSDDFDLVIFGEPSGNPNLIVGYKGNLKLHVAIGTSSGHSASPWLTRNSYEEAYVFWKKFEDNILQNYSESKFENVTGCVTGARAGVSGNSVPSNATLDIDVRIPPNMNSKGLLTAIRRFEAIYREENPAIKVDIAAKDQTEPYLANQNTLGISAFRWAIRKAGLGQMAFIRKTGTSDMNLFAAKRKMPMFAYGPGDSKLDHTNYEHISIPEYLKTIHVYSLALPRFAELMLNSSTSSRTAE